MIPAPQKPLLVIATLFSHWGKHKLQLVTLIIGLASATALWTAVQALNDHARASYDRSAATLAAFDQPAFARPDRRPFDDSAFADFRLAGFMVTPIIEGRLGPPAGGLTITGFEPLTFAPLSETSINVPRGENMLSFFEAPGELLVDPTIVVRLQKLLDQVPQSTRPVVRPQENLGGGQVLGDISSVQRLLGQTGLISKLMVTEPGSQPNAAIPLQWQDKLVLVEPPVSVDLAGLTDSFHLNLTAFGMLCFLVGLFIVYSAIGLAIEDRIAALRTLRICGVSLRSLLGSLVLEMTVLALFAGTLGILGGYLIAAQLLPDVSASLRGLYGAQIGGSLSLEASWWLGGVTVSLLGALGASLGAFIKVSRMALFDARGTSAWRAQQKRTLRLQATVALICFATSSLLFLFGSGLSAAFIVMAGLLLGSAFLLPVILSALVLAGSKTARGPLSEWFWADSKQQLSGLSLALMALLLALGTNIGVSGMVEGFRLTFNEFLDERLSADLYVLATTNEQTLELMDWAKAEPAVTATLPIWGASASIDGHPVSVTGFSDHTSYHDTWQLLQASPSPWAETLEGDGVLINEQLHYRLSLSPGQSVVVKSETGPLELQVAGIYSDYGNPRSEIRLPNARVASAWPSGERRRVAFMTNDAADLQKRIETELAIPADQVIEQKGLKQFSQGVFERTFVISGALSTLTLAVAGVAMVTSLLTLASARINGVAPLWAMGVRRRAITRLEGLKILMLAALTSITAIPLGVAITWCLVDVINVAAFGWRLPLFVFPSQWLTLSLLGLGTAFIASLYPLMKLLRTPASDLAKVFAYEH